MDDPRNDAEGPRGLPPNAWLPADEPRPVYLPPTGSPPPGPAVWPTTSYGPVATDPNGVPLAGWGYRMVAGLIDLALVLAVWIAMIFVLTIALGSTVVDFDKFDLEDEDVQTTTAIIGLAALVICWLAVKSAAAIGLRGASVGKWIAGIAVVKDTTGAPVSFGTSLLREGVCMLPGFLCFGLFFVVDALFPAGGERMSLRDRMSSTLVIQRPAYQSRKVLTSVLAVPALAATIGIVAWITSYDDSGSGDTTASRPGEELNVTQVPQKRTSHNVAAAPLPSWSQKKMAAEVKFCRKSVGKAERYACGCVIRVVASRFHYDRWYYAATLTKHEQAILNDAWDRCL